MSKYLPKLFIICLFYLFIGSSESKGKIISDSVLNEGKSFPKGMDFQMNSGNKRIKNIYEKISFLRNRETAQTFVVSDPSDIADTNLTDGLHSPATLRSAIENANLSTALDLITFSSAAGLIQPLRGLTIIRQPVVIDGKMGTSGNVILDGSFYNPNQGGVITLITDNTIIANLEIRNFPDGGIGLIGKGDNIIQGNYIHHNDGTSILFNESKFNIIGGLNPEERNYIYGQTGTSSGTIQIILNSDSNSIIGNYIGTVDGLNPIYNSRSGMNIESDENFIYGNIICADSSNGIDIDGGSFETPTGNVIESNFIGVGPDGLTPIGNLRIGISIRKGSDHIVENNLISANGTGIFIRADNILVKDNFIGTTAMGDAPLGNSGGINVSGDNIIVEDNLISGNKSTGLSIGASGLIARNNFIGTNFLGTGPLGNQGMGVSILGSNNVIGGPASTDGNIISANTGQGILIRGASANSNKIINNLIGTDINGIENFGNKEEGILITQGAANNIIELNVISGNTKSGVKINKTFNQIPNNNIIIGNTIGLNKTQNDMLPNEEGVWIDEAKNNFIGGLTLDSLNVISGNRSSGVVISGDTSSGNHIRNNLIGTSGAGNAALPNHWGILIVESSGNTVGGTQIGSGNVISGNSFEGVYLSNADSNLIYGNIIGLDAQQTQTLSNGTAGIRIEGSDNNIVGGELDETGNIISGNKESGIWILGSFGNKIFRNAIGTNDIGILKLGNLKEGIKVFTGSAQNIIGKEGDGNIIAYNNNDGINIADSTSNRISGNFIFSNTLLGINLGNDGITLNDPLDPDSGPNNFQNFPALSLAEGAGQLRIFGELHSSADGNFRIEFFSNDSCDPGNFGEGENYLGFTDVTTNLFGNAVFTTVLPVVAPPGKFITSTAADSIGNTSEFCRCTQVLPPGEYADIAVKITDNVDLIEQADTLFYKYNVQNNGPDIATDVVMIDTLSNKISYIYDSTSLGICVYENGILTCNIGSLSVGESAQITLAAKVDSLGIILNKALVSANEADYFLANNFDTDTTEAEISTAVNRHGDELPKSYELHQNYPNPFNPSTRISYSIPEESNVTLTIYNLLGEMVNQLINEVNSPGYYEFTWHAHNLASGVYIYVLDAQSTTGNKSFRSVKKLSLIK